MKIFSQIILSFLFLAISVQLNAQCCNSSSTSACCSADSYDAHRPDGQAPIGVMGDHYHHKGGLMFSYRYMNMNMDGNRNGSNEIEDMAIFQNYMLAPQTMNMQMHMPGVMYAPTNRLTFMLMGNYLVNEMDLIGMNGMEHHHETKGFGDTRLTAVLGFWKSKKQSLHLNTGINIPTGDIAQAETGHHHHEGHQMTKMPYPMQLGSGTWDALFGMTYLGQNNQISWGAQALGTFRTGENSEGYRLGNKYQLTSWVAYKINNWMSASFRATGASIEKMIGNDEELMPMMAPTTNASNFGGEQINGMMGINLYVPTGALKDMRIGIEYGLPIYQNPNGIQMNQSQFLTAGLKYSLF